MDLLNIVAWFAAGLVLLLGPIILVHELGHFLAARRAGVRVEEFGLGLPPRLVTLGGKPGVLSVGPLRMEVPSRFTPPAGLSVGQPVEVLARRADDGRYLVARVRPLSEKFSGDFELSDTSEGTLVRGRLTEYEPGVRYTLNWLPFGGFVRMSGEENPADPRSLAAQPKRWRLAVLLSGPFANILAALLLLTAGYATGFPEQMEAVVEYVEPGTAAEAAGLAVGDRVIAADGEDIVGGPIQLRDIIRSSAGKPLRLEVVRDGKRLTLTAVPRMVEGHGYLGIAMDSVPDLQGLRRCALPAAFRMAVEDTVDMVKTLIQLPRLMAQGEVSPAEARPTSAIGINSILTLSLQQSLDWGIPFPALETAALVSFFLGLTNLLPLPALDGGRALFVIVEAVRGRRIRPEVEALVHQVGMFVLLALMVLVVFQDLFNPVISWSLLNR